MKQRFDFGQNWKNFLEKDFSEQQVLCSCKALSSMLGIKSFRGKSFLDIGCGSGLSSLAAIRLGASKVFSFDYDEQSVEAAKRLHTYSNKPLNWKIFQGDILNESFIKSLPSFDIVYSWGVLHHTGKMNQAIANSIIPLSKNGLLLLALYSYTAYKNSELDGQPSPEEWLDIKQRYLRSSSLSQRMMILNYLWRRFFSSAGWNLGKIAKGGRELYTRWKNYHDNQRGMNFFIDIHDWLGGWPMEYIDEFALQQRMDAEFNMELLRMETGRGNTQFLFRKSISSNDWDDLLIQRKESPLPKPFINISPNVWRSSILNITPNDDIQWLSSRIRLQENSMQLPYAHSSFKALSTLGKGRYLHKNDGVYFSTTDNSDPNKNGRSYTFYVDNQ